MKSDLVQLRTGALISTYYYLDKKMRQLGLFAAFQSLKMDPYSINITGFHIGLMFVNAYRRQQSLPGRDLLKSHTMFKLKVRLVDCEKSDLDNFFEKNLKKSSKCASKSEFNGGIIKYGYQIDQ